MAVTDTNTAEGQARAQLEEIIERVAALDIEESREDAEDAIREDPLSVAVRSAWQTPGATPEFVEYEILLCTGGPAVRIIGSLGRLSEPDSAQIEYQDWGRPWTRLPTRQAEVTAMLKYAQCFYYGD